MTLQVGVVLLGCGTVGSAVLRRIATAKQHHLERYGISFALKAVFDSSGSVMSKETAGIDYSHIISIKAKGESFSSVSGFVPKTEAYQQLQEMHQHLPMIFVDCTATDAITGLLKSAIQRKAGIVFANKKILTGSIADFYHFTAPETQHLCRFESSVGAGTPFVAAINRLASGHDTVSSLQGTFSGTLGFITAGLDNGCSFSDLVKEAFKLGYTEPDPRDDLSGTDVARKALILSRVAGWSRELQDIQIESLFPPELASVSIPDFLSGLTAYDAEIRKRQEEAAGSNCVLRYVAHATQDFCHVGLRSVPQNSPIGQLRGTDNILSVTSSIYTENPLVIQGSGAGPDITASGVVADMVDIAVSLRT